eukprot:TRINITY_DN20305_c0_g1_i1.p1 TRINITY_DN20305_c0_g1~~TRINITY_DN20305_c0_g1_i1.p1  ORF type:complete len:782 (+),score=135.11 TRINITY_DN20305_c0_g1_i1:25-2346(+)
MKRSREESEDPGKRVAPALRSAGNGTAVQNRSLASLPPEDLQVLAVQNAIFQIYNKENSQIAFSFLYASVHQLVQRGHSSKLYRAVEQALFRCLSAKRDYLVNRKDEELLEAVQEIWQEHLVALSLTREVVMLLDKNRRDAPDKFRAPFDDHSQAEEQLSVNTLGLRLFGEVLNDKCCMERCRNLILSGVRLERNGESVPNRGLLRDLTHMLVEISLEQTYVPSLEVQYLEEARLYYTKEASQMFETLSAPEYMQRCLRRLDEEETRVDRSLDPSTRPKITAVLEAVLVKDYAAKLLEKEGSGALHLLRQWNLPDLHKLYHGFARVRYTGPLLELVRLFCQDTGLALLDDKELAASPIGLVTAFLDHRQRWDEFLTVVSSRHDEASGSPLLDADFVTGIDQAFLVVVNRYERTAEYLSIFLDAKMRRSQEDGGDEVASLFDRVLSLFGYLKGKDIFERYYKMHLAKRLLHCKASANSVEGLFLCKLKAAYGNSYTSSLERMFQDMRVSEDLQERYREELQERGHKPATELMVQVLTTGQWPLKDVVPITLPEVMQTAADAFRTWYLGRHKNRTLTFCPTQGTVDVRMFVQRAQEVKRFEVCVSTPQAAILQLFNDTDTLTVEEILKLTQLEPLEARRQLFSLTTNHQHHTCVLKRDRKDLAPTSRVSYNPEFKSKSYKLRLLPATVKESEEDAKDTSSRVDEGRRHILEAAIVRIMKARKQLDHNTLVSLMVDQVRQRFVPSVAMMKERIEDLIERDYLKRSEHSRTVYDYVV